VTPRRPDASSASRVPALGPGAAVAASGALLVAFGTSADCGMSNTGGESAAAGMTEDGGEVALAGSNADGGTSGGSAGDAAGGWDAAGSGGCSGDACCSSPTCGCVASFASCAPGAACETNLHNDPKHCGACGHVCGTGECINGTCSSRVFVTSESYSADLGGVTGADGNCQRLADAAGLKGKFKAWLALGKTTAKDRILKHDAGPYRRLDGVIVAQTWTDLDKQELVQPLAVDESGHALTVAEDSFAWTGMTRESAAVGLDCKGWTSTAFADTFAGIVLEPTKWLSGASASCNTGTLMRLYCFEVDD